MATRMGMAIAAVLFLQATTLAQTSKSGSSSKGNRSELPPSQRRNPYGPYMGPYTGGKGRAPQITTGNNPRVRVQQTPRLDWEFALSPAAASSARAAQLHDSTQTIYQVWVPSTYRPAVPNPLLLFLSAKSIPDEWLTWLPVCRKYGVILASIYDAGEDCLPAKRMRLSLDVLDDIRRRLAVDTDRIYVGGFSQGARTACDLAYAYPEFVGGVVAIGGASSPRPEPWMRQRLKERLSVALLTGQSDPARGEMEKVRYPVLHDLGAQARLWTVPGLGQAMPPSEVLEEALLWMDAKQAARKQLVSRYQTSRMPEGVVPLPEVWARAVVEEARIRLQDAKERESGLLQLEGVTRRWRGGEAARAAEKMLENHDARSKQSWRAAFDRTQQAYYHLEAKALDAYLAGELPARDLGRRKAALQETLAGLWEEVAKYGADTEAGRQATARLAELRKPPARR